MARRIIQKSGENTYVNLPKDMLELLGWNKGDKVMVDCDFKKSEIKISFLERSK
jgi:antitoxin component of MazEF toxin-antitoxin module